MGRYIFPGFPAFLGRAAEELGLAPSLATGSPPGPLAAMANLCAQATAAGPSQSRAILDEAAALRDRLLVAARAADLMLAEVADALAPPAEATARPRRDEGPGRPRSHRPTSHRP